MYAVVEIQGSQFKVEKDQKLFVNRIDAKEGSKVSFDNVLLTDDGNKVQVGKPNISGTSVEAKIIAHKKDDKVIVFKKKRRKGYRVKNGHRQLLTQIQISDISLTGAKAPKKSVKKVEKTEDKKSDKKEDISKLSVAALKDMAKSKGISGISKMKKADLIKALS